MTLLIEEAVNPCAWKLPRSEVVKKSAWSVHKIAIDVVVRGSELKRDWASEGEIYPLKVEC